MVAELFESDARTVERAKAGGMMASRQGNLNREPLPLSRGMTLAEVLCRIMPKQQVTT